jgi:mRNA interferase RelE/StbE
VARFELFIKPSAVKEIESISRKRDRQLIVRRIEQLADDPHPHGSQKLSGRDRYRLRQGPYRILYAIDEPKLVICVVRVAHRKDVYRRPF